VKWKCRSDQAPHAAVEIIARRGRFEVTDFFLPIGCGVGPLIVPSQILAISRADGEVALDDKSGAEPAKAATRNPLAARNSEAAMRFLILI
jgi:hypothetical protein